jgi:type IV pilus assembly protein PilY1
VQDLGAPIVGGRSALVAQTVIAATGGNENIQTPYPAVNPAGNGWYVDLPGLGERALSEPSIVNGMVMFTTVVPQANPCNGGCTGYIYALDRFTGDGGTGFLTANNVSYDALQTTVGCVKGLTLVSSGSTLNWYVTGNGAATTPGASSSGAGGAGGPGNNGSFLNTLNSGGGSAAIEHGDGTMTTYGRISWHAFTP